MKKTQSCSGFNQRRWSRCRPVRIFTDDVREVTRKYPNAITKLNGGFRTIMVNLNFIAFAHPIVTSYIHAFLHNFSVSHHKLNENFMTFSLTVQRGPRQFRFPSLKQISLFMKSAHTFSFFRTTSDIYHSSPSTREVQRTFVSRHRLSLSLLICFEKSRASSWLDGMMSDVV